MTRLRALFFALAVAALSPALLSAAQDDGPAQPPTGYTENRALQSLATLSGKRTLQVLDSIDENFVEKIAISQGLDDEFVSQLAETNLSTSVRYGRSFNRESRAAQARIIQAKAQTGQAKGLLLPTLSLRASAGAERSMPAVAVDETTGELIQDDTHDRTDLSMSLRQTVFDLPKFIDWKRRKVNVNAREESFRINDGDAYLATVDTYLSLVSSRLQANIAHDFENQLSDLLTYIEKRAEAGASSVSDMARVRARSQAIRSSRLELEADHIASGIEFVRLTNMIPHQLVLPVPQDIGATLLPDSFEQAVTAALASNPELAVLQAQTKAANLERKGARAEYLPRVNLDYTDTYSQHAGGSPNDQRDMRLMLSLNWDLYNGGRNAQQIREREGRIKELTYLLDDQRRRVIQELSTNYATLETTRERIQFGYLELESISTAAEAMSQRMLSGNQSLLDLLDVYNQRYQVRSRLVNLHTLEMNTIAKLVRLTRGAP